MYLDEDYLNIKPGARNGQRNGLTILLDVDAFEYEFFPKSSKGFIVALSSAGERPMVRQNGWHRNIIFQSFKFFKNYSQDSMSDQAQRPSWPWRLRGLRWSRMQLISFLTQSIDSATLKNSFNLCITTRFLHKSFVLVILTPQQSILRTLGLATAWPTACTPVWLITSWGPATAPPPSPRCPTWPPWTTLPASPCARGRVWSAWRSRQTVQLSSCQI